MPTLPLVAGIVLVAAGGATLAAGFGAFDDWAGDQKECPWHLDVPLTGSGSGTIRMTFNNSVAPLKVRACVFDDDGFQRVDTTFEVPLAAAHIVDLDVPSGPFLLVAQIYGPSDGDRSYISAIIEPGSCPDQRFSKDYPVGEFMGYSWYGLRPAQCVATGEIVEIPRPDSEGSSMSFGSLPLSGGPGFGLGSFLTATGLMTIGLANLHAVALGSVALYSRLIPPRLLDQPTRSRILQLVEQRPGIRFKEIANVLELGQGRALHHVHVLLRERLVCRLRHAYFAVGRHSRDEMLRIAALETPAARALYEAVRSEPNSRVVDLARGLGVSSSWAAKMAKRLEQAGLVARHRAGRTCRVAAREPPV